LLVATHGRALWILDHLEPIQEYSAAQASPNDAHLFLPPTALQWKAKDDRNDEFWGHDFFTGENPPVDALVSVYLKRSVPDLKLKITNASGAAVRELPISGSRNAPGIQSICWDQRVEPIPTTGRGGRGGGDGAPLNLYAGPPSGGPPAPGGAVPVGSGPIPGYPTPLPTIGHSPEFPCGFASGRGGGGAGAGPQVVPGTYSVALVAGGKTLETKSIKIVMDPAVTMTDANRQRWNAILMDLHDLQRRGTQTETQLAALNSQMSDAASKVKAASDIPSSVKSQFDVLQKDFDAVRVKFGVGPSTDTTAAASGRGGRGGGGRGGAGRGGAGGGNESANVLARVATLKTTIGGIWEPPSEALTKRYADAKSALSAAIAEANAALAKASAMAPTLKQYGIDVNVPK
jgi:hypothetical protein